MKSKIALLMGLTVAGVIGAGAAHAQDGVSADPKFIYWSDTSLTGLYGKGFEVDPNEQTTITFEHVHGSKIGDFFMFVDFQKFHGTAPGQDDKTWYGEISPRLSFGKIFGKDLSYGPIKDVLLAATYERGEDPDVAEAALLGLGFDLNVGNSGFSFAQVNIYGRNELTEGARGGVHDAQVTLVTARPFEIGKAKFLVDGYIDWVLGLGSQDWNLHVNPQVSMDVGNIWGAPNKFYVGAEIDLWWNKYQIPNSVWFDTNQNAVSLMFKYHL
jgi:nucleoside-specific outer membrane channel protein Tsx